ncbi:RWD domain containing 1 [Trypanosoma rangeli]|uniref:RWD domain containing 1 n=1 Tax=Trypanosoma rangeli TaxID=5698 RepID=A0A422NCD6_TRYRA|nr:RWD domain containing 1 [Trypanosoma rangeli]RNF03170.1 RWD domain containing 1 [Trypanosoma rangeli]|eukprot:RNF03170.1 RWD domain containing 1 [Trypanosoma rangeli]
MPATEMQSMEMDMVQGMYDTYELSSLDPPTYSVLLAPTADDPPELRVTIVYDSEGYPETAAPTVRLEHHAKHRRMQITTLAKEIENLCAEHIGMHSVISVLQRAQEYLTEYAVREENAELQRRGDVLAKAAASASTAAPDPTLRIGTAVTCELFAEWSEKHMEEKQRARSVNEKKSTKLTGRQLWAGALKNTDWDLFDTDDGDGQNVDFYALADGEGDEMDFDLDDTEEEG